MADKKKIDLILSVFDIIVGTIALTVFIFGRFFSLYIASLPFLSPPFLATLALPAFVLLSGIASLARTSFAPMTTAFVSFLGIVNSLAVLFSYDQPLFLNQGAPSSLIVLFQNVIPVSALMYFCLRGIFAIWEVKRNASQDDAKKPIPSFQSTEYYCASCGERLGLKDDVCPSCKSIIRGRQCSSCGYEAKESEFIEGRCPRCGENSDVEK